MAQIMEDPSNLKSFQRISLEDARYLKALGSAMALARELSDLALAAKKEEKFDLKLTFNRLVEQLKTALDKMLYETATTHDVYASRD